MSVFILSLNLWTDTDFLIILGFALLKAIIINVWLTKKLQGRMLLMLFIASATSAIIGLVCWFIFLFLGVFVGDLYLDTSWAFRIFYLILFVLINLMDRSFMPAILGIEKTDKKLKQSIFGANVIIFALPFIGDIWRLILKI